MDLKEIRIKNLIENQEMEIQLMLKGTEEKKTATGRTDDNSSYYVIGTFSDRKESNGLNKTIAVKFWGTRKADFDQKFPVGTVMDLFVKASLYRSSLTYAAGKTYGKANPEDYNPSDFIAGAPISFDDMVSNIKNRLKKFDEKHQDHKKLVEALYEKYAKDLSYSAAAAINHHAYLGGCAFHQYRPFMYAFYLPYRNYTASLKRYSDYILKAKGTYPDASMNAKFIGDHTKTAFTEEQREQLFDCFDSNPYLQPVLEPLAVLLNLETYDLRRVYCALRICSVLGMNYAVLDVSLMQAAILLLACDLKNTDDAILLYGKRYLLSQLFDTESENDKLMVSMLHSTEIGSDLPDHEINIPEAFVTSEVWKMAQYSCIDIQLVASAFLIHDIGKIKELDTDVFGNATYTVDGSLQGHILLGMKLVKETSEELEINPDTTNLFLHIIASHHGFTEWGALAEPAFPEAAVVHHLDMIDSRMDTYEKALSEMEPGSMSDKKLGVRLPKVYKKAL